MKDLKKILSIPVFISVTLALCSCKTEKDISYIEWYIPRPTANMSNQGAVEEAANRIIYDKIGAKLRFQFVKNFDEKMNILISTGEPFDICLTCGWQNKFIPNVKRGAFLPLNDLLSKYGKDILKQEEDFAWKTASVDGKIYAIPGQNIWSPIISCSVRKDFAEKYGLDIGSVKNIKDLEPFFEKIKENEPNIIPLGGDISSMISDRRYYSTDIEGLIFTKDTQTFMCELDAPQMLENLRTIHKFYEKGYIDRNAASKKNIQSEINEGRYAVFPGVTVVDDGGAKTSATVGYDVLPIIFGQESITNASVQTAMTAISKTSPNPEKSMQLINLVWQDKELLNLLAYGIEGSDYTVVSGAGTDDISVLPNSGVSVRYGVAHNWLGPLFNQWDSPWNSKESLMKIRKQNEIGEVSPLLGFIINTDGMETELSRVSSILNSANVILKLGSMEDFDKFIGDIRAKLDDAGMNKIIQEVTRQYNEWKSGN